MQQVARILTWLKSQELIGAVKFTADTAPTLIREYDDERVGYMDVVRGTWADQTVIEEWLPLGGGSELIYRLRAEGAIE